MSGANPNRLTGFESNSGGGEGRGTWQGTRRVERMPPGLRLVGIARLHRRADATNGGPALESVIAKRPDSVRQLSARSPATGGSIFSLATSYARANAPAHTAAGPTSAAAAGAC
ncbi:hypothetical protein GCM10018962_15420 [Dactylosporangium matsuzakiense]|uniref:Uncharacterized protein n=1 Tax=Dactylosporangium matsuzakiense TaxID=53360 RepID=A0A9W6KTV9_9ACTN|nr:hypothetical protein GCM10017581_071260 [Dactylosporangium matsuzakiense]